MAVLMTTSTGLLAKQIHIENGYVKATIPGTKNTAAYLHLTNQSDAKRTLVGVESSVAKAVEIHNHVMDKGMMRMRKVEELEVAAGESLTFQPGGLHIMFIQTPKRLKEGESVEVKLVFKNGDKQAVTLPVKKQSLSEHSDHSHHH